MSFHYFTWAKADKGKNGNNGKLLMSFFFWVFMWLFQKCIKCIKVSRFYNKQQICGHIKAENKTFVFKYHVIYCVSIKNKTMSSYKINQFKTGTIIYWCVNSIHLFEIEITMILGLE